MKIQTILKHSTIIISEPMIDDIYYIEQDDSTKNFHITSKNGYYEKDVVGYKEIESALKKVKNLIKNYFVDRCEENPKGW